MLLDGFYSVDMAHVHCLLSGLICLSMCFRLISRISTESVSAKVIGSFVHFSKCRSSILHSCIFDLCVLVRKDLTAGLPRSQGCRSWSTLRDSQHGWLKPLSGDQLSDCNTNDFVRFCFCCWQFSPHCPDFSARAFSDFSASFHWRGIGPVFCIFDGTIEAVILNLNLEVVGSHRRHYTWKQDGGAETERD